MHLITRTQELLPVGHSTIIHGPEGSGKILVLLEVLDAIRRGGRFRSEPIRCRRPLIATTPFLADTLFLPDDDDAPDMVVLGDEDASSVAGTIGWLTDMVRIESPDLLIVHPMMMLVGGDPELAASALRALEALAVHMHIAVLGVLPSHLAPAASGALNAAEHRWHVEATHVEATDVEAPIETPRIWLHSAREAREIAAPPALKLTGCEAAPAPAHEPTDAASFLLRALRQGEEAEREILWRARCEGIEPEALTRAKFTLGVRSVMRTANGSRHRAWRLDRTG